MDRFDEYFDGDKLLEDKVSADELSITIRCRHIFEDYSKKCNEKLSKDEKFAFALKKWKEEMPESFRAWSISSIFFMAIKNSKNAADARENFQKKLAEYENRENLVNS